MRDWMISREQRHSIISAFSREISTPVAPSSLSHASIADRGIEIAGTGRAGNLMICAVMLCVYLINSCIENIN
jgi:hypothetical protein